jgi:benzoyl-CoA reductase/2-hydroxyglutaryl-CoA dehydratase subunit BcrC/BadD/HgdB
LQASPTLPRRSEAIRSFEGQGGSIAAVFPIHYPRALLRACNLLPVEVWGPPAADTGYAADHLQPYLCSIVHSSLSFVLSGGLDLADVLVVPHGCDSLQGLGTILIDLVDPGRPVMPIYLPRGRRASDVDFLADEFRYAFQRLEEVTGRRPSADDLMQSITREEEADHLLAHFHHNRQRIPLADGDFYRLIRSREYLPAETFIKVAQGVLDAGDSSQARSTHPDRETVPIVLSGTVPEPMALLDSISNMGGRVVADDLACCGRRLYPAGTSEEPFRRMAERIINGPPDPTRGAAIAERLPHLIGLTETSGAKGVVFYEVKFCEPELFYLPILSKELKARGIPSLTLEVDINDPLPHQVVTRIEAFLEMIR